jgi:hypothetical protein
MVINKYFIGGYGDYFMLNFHMLLIVINGYSIDGYSIGGYFIHGY